MNHSSHADIDRAVLLARRVAAAGHLERPEPLTRFLYQHWFLGRTPRTSSQTSGQSGNQASGQTSGPRVPAQRTVAPGPWRTWGPRWEQRDCRGEQLLRVYFACAPRTSLHVVGAVTAHAQQWDVPWLLSSRAMSQPVPTADATVLYLPVEALPDLRASLGELVEEVQPFLGSTVPEMTLRVAPGVALAQNTADGRPYGEHRCSLIAGTVLAHARRDHREVVERTTAAFRRAGIDPRRPYRTLDATWSWTPHHVAA
jgi:hypothetical protein